MSRFDIALLVFTNKFSWASWFSNSMVAGLVMIRLSVNIISSGIPTNNSSKSPFTTPSSISASVKPGGLQTGSSSEFPKSSSFSCLAVHSGKDIISTKIKFSASLRKVFL